MAQNRLDSKQIAELVAQLQEDSTSTQEKLIEVSHPDTAKSVQMMVALEVAKAFISDNLHPKPEVVYETIQLLGIHTRILTLGYLSKNMGIFTNKIAEETMKRAHRDLESIIDDYITQGDKEALEIMHFISGELYIPGILLAKARSAMFALEKSLASELPQIPTLTNKEPIYVNSSHQINIEPQWTECIVNLEHSTGSNYLTIDAVFSDDEYRQRVVVKSEQNSDAEELLRKVKMAGFQEVNLRINREWKHYSFKRDSRDN